MSKEFKIEVFGEEITITQNADGTFNKPDFVNELKNKGSAIKPAHEPLVLARKPLSEKTIVDNCIKHGTGALNIDSCRIPTSQVKKNNSDYSDKGYWGNAGGGGAKRWTGDGTNNPQGRFPANLLVTDDALNDGEIQCNYRPNSTGKKYKANLDGHIYGKYNNETYTFNPPQDSGSKSRYFDIDVWAEKHGLIQVPKASKSERNKGLEHMPKKCSPNTEDKPNVKRDVRPEIKTANIHPAVKPIHLISWLIRLVSKEGDTVLDPFTGSGTTAVACINTGRNFIGIEKDKYYCDIANKRIEEAKREKQERLF